MGNNQKSPTGNLSKSFLNYTCNKTALKGHTHSIVQLRAVDKEVQPGVTYKQQPNTSKYLLSFLRRR